MGLLFFGGVMNLLWIAGICLADGARAGRLILQQASYFWPGDDASSSGFFLRASPKSVHDPPATSSSAAPEASCYQSGACLRTG